MHVVGRGGAGIVGLGHGVLHQPHGGGLQVVQALLQRLGEGRELLVGAVLLAELADLLEEGLDGAAAIEAELAADEVERLDAVGALVDHGDAGIAHELAHAVLFDVAVAAEHLLRHHRVLEALVGEHALDDRRHQAEVVVGRLAVLLVARAVGDVGLDRRPQDQRAAGLVEGPHGHQLAADVGVDDDRVGLLVRRLGTGQRAALDALPGVGDGVLVGDLADRQALQADAEARLVHHHEHGLQAAILLADEEALRLVVVHDAGGVAVDAHLLLDGAAGDAVALARDCRRRRA